MELEQLRLFAAVAEAHSFSAAARKLFMSHSTTSRAVSALERELDVRLFDRVGKSVTLTPAGQTLLRHAQALLDGAELAKKETRAAARKMEE